MLTTLLRRALALLFCATVVFMEPSCIRFSYEVKISGPVEITDQWLELKPETPLKAERDLQMVMLELEPPLRDDGGKEGRGPNKGVGILMPDGDVVNPEIQVVDRDGNTFDLVYAGARKTVSPVYDLPYPNKWPRDREYKTVRIRSPKPIKCKAIYWFCESTKDWK